VHFFSLLANTRHQSRLELLSKALRPDGIIIRSANDFPPELQIVGRLGDRRVKWAAVWALVCMHSSLQPWQSNRHGRHSTARKRPLLQSPLPSDQSAQSACMQVWKQSNGVRFSTVSTMSTIVDACCPITTLFKGSETPHALPGTSCGRLSEVS
jgi:hypothetical protein